MFVGATALALGYEIFQHWVAINPNSDPALLEEGGMKKGDSDPKE